MDKKYQISMNITNGGVHLFYLWDESDKEEISHKEALGFFATSTADFTQGAYDALSAHVLGKILLVAEDENGEVVSEQSEATFNVNDLEKKYFITYSFRADTFQRRLFDFKDLDACDCITEQEAFLHYKAGDSAFPFMVSEHFDGLISLAVDSPDETNESTFLSSNDDTDGGVR